ncbi:cyanase [Magnetospira sp. QH-2]|uniref:cyanase n=1 Tax=Magnetospira sp. (strain QH-2) TaxID=1288970 RepID=UPI0003E81731|nr:cyanase [Magnetospira sp. QH-2]CCQ74205.1 Cyanate hydratase (Cyanase) (Cyanate lyase) (Cyanate hydrolase) [Magnetospira sp. QH-2]
MNRLDVTEKIIATKLAKDLKWADVAKEIGQSKEWATTGLLGQMQMNEEEAATAAKIFDLTDEEAKWLTTCPYRGGLGQSVPTDALVYRFYEIIQVYGPTIKALIEEEFGDGIMSAIDFSMDISREEDPKGDRVIVMLNGKFLPYKRY